MTAIDTLRALAADPKPTRVRVGRNGGCGDWHDPTKQRFLAVCIDALNRIHGPGSHWLEWE